MSHLRGLGLKWPLVGGIVGLGGLLSYLRLRPRRRRPTAAELMSLDEAAFEAFIRGTGIRTMSSSESSKTGGLGD
jgi:hypothetical protein